MDRIRVWAVSLVSSLASFFHAWLVPWFPLWAQAFVAPVVEPTVVVEPVVVVVRYEDKYLEDIRRMNPASTDSSAESTTTQRNLDHTFVMEKTPVGNVILFYDSTLDHFAFYADSTIPYRYLEVVARKYVKMFNCRSLYIDMHDERYPENEKKNERGENGKSGEKVEEEKAEEENVEKENVEKEKAEEEKAEEEKVEVKKESIKKSVFASFKTYNRTTTNHHVSATRQTTDMSTRQNPTTSNPSATNEDKQNTNQTIRPEPKRANHYTCYGKIANFQLLPKVDPTLTHKTLAISYADFQKSLQQALQKSL